LRGIIFTNGFGRQFPGDAAGWIELGARAREKIEKKAMSDPKPESSKAENPKSADPKPRSPQPRESNTPAVAGLAIAVVLLVVGLWLAHELRAASKMQDCVLSGRTNCNEIQP
jgi:hypothetical protein